MSPAIPAPTIRTGSAAAIRRVEGMQRTAASPAAAVPEAARKLRRVTRRSSNFSTISAGSMPVRREKCAARSERRSRPNSGVRAIRDLQKGRPARFDHTAGTIRSTMPNRLTLAGSGRPLFST
ncbi:MAG: hypothetical protein ABR517_08030 [Thermoanaerobaculia bacterium]